jgi:hypothetical protein
MVNENSDFALTNKPTENETEYLEADPFNNESIAKIVLYIDWEKKEATIETRYNTGSFSGRVYNGLASEFSLPTSVDAVRFPDFYKEKVLPILQKMNENFDTEWDGSNWKGIFKDNDPELNYFWEIEEVLQDAPEHDKYVYFDVADSFQHNRDIIGILAPQIRFLYVDLSDMENIRKIRAELEDSCVFLETDEEVQKDLIRMKESIIEEIEEEE